MLFACAGKGHSMCCSILLACAAGLTWPLTHREGRLIGTVLHSATATAILHHHNQERNGKWPANLPYQLTGMDNCSGCWATTIGQSIAPFHHWISLTTIGTHGMHCTLP